MKVITEYIARSIVEYSEQVIVQEFQTGNRIRLELSVAKEDMGRIIGKNGRVANSIRALLRVIADREAKQVLLDVIEPR